MSISYLKRPNAFLQVFHMPTILHPHNHGILRLSLMNGEPAGAMRPRLSITLILRELNSWGFPDAVS